MSDEAGLIADIREQRDDDTARLVYADWLEENGDAVDRLRAELIREECRPTGPGRSERLREALEGPWLGPLRSLVSELELSRGVVELVRVTAAQLLRSGEEVARLAPTARVVLTLAGDDADRVAGCPALRHVRRLESRGGGLGDEGARRLFLSPHLAALEVLVLHGCSLTYRVVPDLLSLDLTRLRRLNLGANNLRDEGLELLCQSPALAGLEVLGLGANELRLEAARSLARSPYLHRLRDVNLGANYLDDAAIECLAGAAILGSMRRLDVRSNEFQRRGAVLLMRSPHLQGLEFLDLSGNRLGERTRAMVRDHFGGRVVL